MIAKSESKWFILWLLTYLFDLRIHLIYVFDSIYGQLKRGANQSDANFNLEHQVLCITHYLRFFAFGDANAPVLISHGSFPGITHIQHQDLYNGVSVFRLVNFFFPWHGI